MAAHTSLDAVEATVAKQEPVLVRTAALWLLAQSGEFLYGHTHLITKAQWTPLQSTLIPVVTTALLALFAWALRSVVSPALTFASRVEATVDAEVKKVTGVNLDTWLQPQAAVPAPPAELDVAAAPAPPEPVVDDLAREALEAAASVAVPPRLDQAAAAQPAQSGPDR